MKLDRCGIYTMFQDTAMSLLYQKGWKQKILDDKINLS